MEPEFKQAFIQDKAYLNQQSSQGIYVLWSRHAIQELIADNLTRKQVERALQSCEVIENYPTLHRPLPDCLVLGWVSAYEPIHIVVAIDMPKDGLSSSASALPGWLGRSPKRG